jgi:translocation and assembly module TamB
MRRPVKIGLYAAAGLAGAALLLIAAAFVVVRTSWFHEQVRRRMVSEIENATGGRVELAGFGFDWHSMTASARGLTIHGTEGKGEAPLFHADLIRVGLKIVSILEKRVDLESVRVERPQVNLIVYPDGRTNFPKPKAAQRPRRGAVETVLDLAVRRFDLNGGTVRAQMQRLPLDLHGENLRAAIGYRAGPARYEGELSFRSLDVKMGRQPALPVDIDARLVLERDRLEIQRARMTLYNSKLEASGTLDHFAAPVVRAAYNGRVYVKDVTEGERLGPLAHRGVAVVDGQAAFSEASGSTFSGKLAASGLTFETGGVRIDGIRVESKFAAAHGRIELKDLAVLALAGRFDGRGEIASPGDFRAEGAVRGFSLNEMRYIHEVRRVTWNGGVSGPVHLAGAVRRAKLERFNVNALLDIAPAPGDNPVQGRIDLTYNHPADELVFGPSDIATRASHLAFSGILGRSLSVSADTTNLGDAGPAIAMFTAGPPPQMPVKLVNGTARFRGAVEGPLRSPEIRGHAAATNVVWDGRSIDRAEADITVSGAGIAVRNASIAKDGLRASGGARIGFTDWKPEASGAIAGEFSVSAPNLAQVLEAVNVTLPFEAASGRLTAGITLGGSIGAPQVSGHAQADAVVLEGQPIEHAQGDAQYTGSLIEISGVQLQHGPSRVRLSARLSHPAGNWREGRLQFQIATRGVGLSQLQAVRERVPEAGGRIEMQMAGEVTLAPHGFRPGTLSGEIAVKDLTQRGERLGSLVLSAATQAQEVDVRLDGDLAGSKISGSSTWGLQPDYPAKGQIDFSALDFSALLARLRNKPGTGPPPFEGTAAGALQFSGSALDTGTWRLSAEIPAFEIRPAARLGGAASSPDLILRNAGPLLFDVDARGARIRQARFHAKDTDLTATGRVGFSGRSRWDARIQGSMNLALLRDFESRMYSAGSVALDVSVRGALDNPDVYGRVDLSNASVNFADFPNGIENANGTIFLYRDRAIIDTLTAQSGGGKVSLTGFASLGEVMTFHLRATATGVRVRYPEDISSTVNATLAFTGTLERSVLSGNATVTRMGLNLSSDLGSILARSAQPVQAPAQPSRFLQGLRLDVHIVTAPQVRLETQLTKDVLAEADLRLRGDGTRPVLLGRVLINQGQVNFFGNQYTINSGQILFVNAAKIEPNINLDLGTRVRGIDVTLHISGPVDRLNMSYTSDPPLPFNDVVALLTTGREPGLTSGQTPTLVGQSYGQGGASTLLSQAIASPITGRLQRFFGVSRLKIDPLVTGMTSSNATARVTIEQNITKNLTFTYITDLSRAQGQTIRIEWDLTGTWSAVAVREENGMFGIDFLYRKQVK